MFKIKKRIVLLSTIILSLWSSMAMAAKGTAISSTLSGWPLPIFLVGIIIFRKKIFHGHDLPTLEPDEIKPKPKGKSVNKKTTNSKPKTTPVKKVALVKEEASKDTSKDFIDLTDGVEQCQGSTSKGSRCKRTNTLANITLVVESKTYQLTICAQHNNDKLKPYPGLIK